MTELGGSELGGVFLDREDRFESMFDRNVRPSARRIFKCLPGPRHPEARGRQQLVIGTGVDASLPCLAGGGCRLTWFSKLDDVAEWSWVMLGIGNMPSQPNERKKQRRLD